MRPTSKYFKKALIFCWLPDIPRNLSFSPFNPLLRNKEFLEKNALSDKDGRCTKIGTLTIDWLCHKSIKLKGNSHDQNHNTTK